MTSPKINLDTLSLDELEKLHKDVAAAIKSYQQRKKDEAKAVLEKKAQELGFTLDEFLDDTKKKSKPKKISPKYADPSDPSQTWSGRGRKPRWVETYLAQGKTLEDLRI